MKHLVKINDFKINESFKNTDDEILEFFVDYYDIDKNNFNIKNVLVFNNERVVDETPYLKNASKYRKAKLVKVLVEETDGVFFPGGKSLTSLESLRNILSDLERFYDISGEDISYKINTDYMGLSIEFLVLGEEMKEDSNKSKVIDDLLKELKSIFVKRRFRPSLRSNLIELRTSGHKSKSRYGDYSVDLRSIFKKINDGDVNLENSEGRWIDYIEWRNKVHDNGLTIYTSGGDHQFLIKLKNQ